MKITLFHADGRIEEIDNVQQYILVTDLKDTINTRMEASVTLKCFAAMKIQEVAQRALQRQDDSEEA